MYYKYRSPLCISFENTFHRCIGVCTLNKLVSLTFKFIRYDDCRRQHRTPCTVHRTPCAQICLCICAVLVYIYLKNRQAKEIVPDNIDDTGATSITGMTCICVYAYGMDSCDRWPRSQYIVYAAGATASQAMWYDSMCAHLSYRMITDFFYFISSFL